MLAGLRRSLARRLERPESLQMSQVFRADRAAVQGVRPAEPGKANTSAVPRSGTALARRRLFTCSVV
jgi:hypothetical protein